jgi:hypothetical protein
MEAINSTKTSVLTTATRHRFPEDYIIQNMPGLKSELNSEIHLHE